MGVVVLFPGGFKPPTAGHLNLAQRYAENPNVDRVEIIIGPDPRGSVSREDSIAIWKILDTNPKINITAANVESPMSAAYEYLFALPIDSTGTYALASSSKGGDDSRVGQFNRAVEKYKTTPTKKGETVPKGIKIVDASDLGINIDPLVYSGRGDEHDGKGISASVLRQDLASKSLDKFATNYPGIDKGKVNQIYDILAQTEKPIADKIEELAVFRTLLRQLIVEGGKVFKANPTERINRADVPSTIDWLEKKTGLSLKDSMLGTTGKKETSGDIDLGVDKNKVDQNALIQTLIKNGIRKDDIKKSGTNVHVRTPIAGDESGAKKYVQTDFMFNDDVDFMKFSMQGGRPDSQYKGVHKHLLLASIAKSKGLKWSYLNGLMDRKTDKTISKDPQEIATMLLGPGAKPNDITSVESILDKIQNMPDYETMVAQARVDFNRDGLTLPSKVDEVLRKLIESIVLNEAEGARIQHPEDLVYWDGKKGAESALDGIKSAASNPQSVSIKWDGSPAIIFGADENGDFILTDKGGFNAKGYDGKPKSADAIEDMFKNRAIKSAEKSGTKPNFAFASMMRDAFDAFKASWPEGLKGFFKGDMLYLSKPELKDGEYVFTPNIVTYKVKQDSDIGKMIQASDIGVIPHVYETLDGKTEVVKDPSKYGLQSGKLAIFSPIFPKTKASIDKSLLSKASSAVSSLGDADKVLDKTNLSSKKMSNFADLLYKFTNNVGADLSNLTSDRFTEFINQEASLSTQKKQNIASYVDENKDSLDKIFNAVKAIAELKNSVIANYDQQTSDVSASIDGSEGGEGYVVSTPSGPIKLVNRSGFTAANRAKQR